MPLTTNQQLFEYRIERILGRGAFGTVYLAHDTLLDRPVAIEELTVPAQTDEVAFKRFLQEARAAGGLNHPHVVTVHALKVVEPNVYLVMEYLAGGSLRALLEKRGPLPAEDAVHIAADVCVGLAAAHARSRSLTIVSRPAPSVTAARAQPTRPGRCSPSAWRPRTTN